jgi:hypothetical protein
MAVSAWEECPPEAVWEFEEEDGSTVRIDSRKVPEGVTQEGFLSLVIAGVLDYTKFLVDGAVASEAVSEVTIEQAAETAMNGAKNLFSETGELNLGAPEPPTEAEEFINGDGKKAIVCTNCKHEVTYQRLGNGGTKKCDFCGHINKVVKL